MISGWTFSFTMIEFIMRIKATIKITIFLICILQFDFIVLYYAQNVIKYRI